MSMEAKMQNADLDIFSRIDPEMFGDLDYGTFPKMVKVRQKFECPQIDDVGAMVASEMKKPEIEQKIRHGARIAVLVGSRGISQIDRIVRSVIDELKAKGAEPFIVPAMASHGGATEAGQCDLLGSYGITEQSMGVKIRSTMIPEEIGVTPGGVRIYFDVNALHADGVIPINRIKAHTAFRGPRESGLIKMLAIGAGKQKGAESLHSHGADTFATLLPEAFHVIRQHVNVLFGIGIVENCNERAALLEAIPVEDIENREVELLKLANRYMPRILIDRFDALIVGESGKDISGDGMDPNVTGRFAVPNMQGGPEYQRLALLDVTEESHGNVAGVGLADVTTRKLIRKANLQFMYMNAFTSKMVIPLVKIPMVALDDRQAIGVMLRTCVRVEKGREKVVYIKNTLEVKDIWVSETLAENLYGDGRFKILSEPFAMQFDADGNLLTDMQSI